MRRWSAAPRSTPSAIIGANHLIGNDGANLLDGGDGADILEGGKGVGHLRWSTISATRSPKRIAGAAGGIDLVKSEVSFTLGANLENADPARIGRHRCDRQRLCNNMLIGNAGDNILDGGAGSDAMTGGKGDDTYIVENAGDSVIE